MARVRGRHLNELQAEIEVPDEIVPQVAPLWQPGAQRAFSSSLIKEVTYRVPACATDFVRGALGAGGIAAAPTGYDGGGGGGGGGVRDRCVICLSDFEDGETLKQLPCLHLYHAACISTWFSTRRVRGSAHTRCLLFMYF